MHQYKQQSPIMHFKLATGTAGLSIYLIKRKQYMTVDKILSWRKQTWKKNNDGRQESFRLAK